MTDLKISQFVVINACFGGFGVSDVAIVELRKMGNEHALKEVIIGDIYPDSGQICDIEDSNSDFPRDDPDLLRLLAEWGSERVSGSSADLKVVEIPHDVKWEIKEYDGTEWIAETHRTWR